MLAHLAAFRELGVSVGEVDLDGKVHVAEVVVGGDGRVGAEGGMGGGGWEEGRKDAREERRAREVREWPLRQGPLPHAPCHILPLGVRVLEGDVLAHGKTQHMLGRLEGEAKAAGIVGQFLALDELRVG